FPKISIESFDKFNFEDSQWPVIIAQGEISPSNATLRSNVFDGRTSINFCPGSNNGNRDPTFSIVDSFSFDGACSLTPPIILFPNTACFANDVNSVSQNYNLNCNGKDLSHALESSMCVEENSLISRYSTTKNLLYKDCQITMSHPQDRFLSSGHVRNRLPDSNPIKKEGLENNVESDLLSSNYDLNYLCDFITTDELFSGVNIDDLPKEISDCFDDIYHNLDFEQANQATSIVDNTFNKLRTPVTNNQYLSNFVPIDHEYCKFNIDDHIDRRITQPHNSQTADASEIVVFEQSSAISTTPFQVDMMAIEQRDDDIGRRLKYNESSRISRLAKKCKLEARRSEIVALEDRNASLRSEITAMENLRDELKRQFSILVNGH
uniref:BZIP domain-containing protein n=1 Tax=Romanomermis culicivorax TaxID=13658 RepID=A0A915KX61_ROMCU